MDWYPWYPTDFKGATYRLTLAEDGAYRRLIDEYMLTQTPLPDDDKALARIIGVGLDEWLAASPAVRQFFRVKDGRLIQKRCEQELAAQNTRKQRYSERGQKAAFAKYSNPNYMRASRKFVPATLHNIGKLTSTEYASAREESGQPRGDASGELSSIIQMKGWGK